ncbi:hypothetical protein TPHA_0C02020 [Tetrapisispora phaffii CBS 4417]|uniref:CID domain-containing protein n=1 Tax=Tetrapisispora phaffii (strain ATCC 24235 / CBS 4417 / NBRC 1672 / NRRL Y-8282 / UCD 70-5) TaxID=1071381 RepID=G8BRI1_TETPH|nr:hypothetical protein TPHA_0C02020 [Tetrapisispora phaffii CBS 4417]CCE62357.1 hypothetical protein TPHA_0C02020 [Tetrapisispora phaffii CBS 4417]
MDRDQEAIVKDFTSILDELTFNSRPIITTLTKMAEENISLAQYFVDALESRVEKCVPKQKLYAFYTIDSICKNAGSPYTIYFSRNLYNLYKKAYLLVDNQVRTKLINMFKTWIQPIESTGLPIFDNVELDKIENFLIKASALHHKNFTKLLPEPTVPLLLRDIDKLTTLTNERLTKQKNSDSNDEKEIEKLNMKILVLSQLKQELQKGKLTKVALKQVQVQLLQVFAQDQQVLQERIRQEQLQQEQLQQRQRTEQLQLQQLSHHQNAAINQQFQIKNDHNPLFGNSLNLNPQGFSTLFNNSNFIPMNQNMDDNNTMGGMNLNNIIEPANISNIEKQNKLNKMHSLFESLKAEKLVFQPKEQSIITLNAKLNIDDGKLINNSGRAKSETDLTRLPSIEFLSNIISDCKAYFSTVNIDIVNTPSLNISQDFILGENKIVENNLINTLYRAKPKKCTLCGKRFGNTLDERRLQSDHLDWHFRINKRIKGSENTLSNITATNSSSNTTQKNIQSRNWYLHDSQWIIFKDKEIVSTSRSDHSENNMTVVNLDFNTNMNSQKNNNINNADRNLSGNESNKFVKIDEGLLSKKYVIVPESVEDMSFKCPVCKEIVAATYDEELGEWIWKGCMEYKGKYFHATCYYESAKNKNTSIGLELDMEKLKNLITD